MKITCESKGFSFGVTDHALRRFIQRHMLVHPEFDIRGDALAIMQKSFAYCVETEARFMVERGAYHTKDTRYFRNTNFTFIVQGVNVVTVVITASRSSSLNDVAL